MNETASNLLGILVGIGIVSLIVALVLLANRQAGESLSRVYYSLAPTWQARVKKGDLFQRPAMIFSYQGMPVTVDTFSTRRNNAHREYTRLRMPWRDYRLRMTVHPEQTLESIGKLLGMQDIRIGSPHFDAVYIIAGNNEPEICRILTPAVQQIIETLRGLPGQARGLYSSIDIYVKVMAGDFEVKKPGRITDPAVLHQFISLCLALYEQSWPQGEGIEFLETATLRENPGAEAPVCQVCGEAIVATPVFCRSCKTPHHQDCWEYNGVCSTYGCREVRTSQSVR